MAIPFISAGLGVIQEDRDNLPIQVSKQDCDMNGNNCVTAIVPGTYNEARFDTGSLLTFGVGARTFFTENWAIRYEVRYFHHDTLETNQDEFSLGVGATWVIGGQN